MHTISRNTLLVLMRFFTASAVLAFSEYETRADEATGVVLAVEGKDIFLDLGQNAGISQGSRVHIWRPLNFKHPETGATITDRFLIGTLTIRQLRQTSSLAQAVGTLGRPPEIGDVVIAPSLPPAPVKKLPETVSRNVRKPVDEDPYSEPFKKDDDEVASLVKMFDRLRGTDLATRISILKEFVQGRPSSPLARQLEEEAQALQLVLDAKRKGTRENDGIKPLLVNFTKPTGVVAGVPIEMAMELSDEVVGAVVHLRFPGEPNYRTFPMTPLGSGYYSAAIPAYALKNEQVQFFAEAATKSSEQPIPIVGSSATPEQMQLEPAIPDYEPAKFERTVAVSCDFISYNGLYLNDTDKMDDYMLQTEGMISLRYGDVGIRALRTGFGVYYGETRKDRESTPQEIVDSEQPVNGMSDDEQSEDETKTIGLAYGYLELEIGLNYGVSLLGRTLVGRGRNEIHPGVQAMVRIGNDKNTNLLLGGEVLDGIGVRGMTQVELYSFRQFPMLLRVEVTNQPAGVVDSHIGVRGMAQLGWSVVDALVFSVRGSFQGRSVDRAGPGFGAAVSYRW